MSGYLVIIRSGAKVTKERLQNLDAAMAVVERHGREIEDGASTRPAGGTLLRRYEPVQQVAGRIELRGPRHLRAGVDVRGDGSTEAFTGRLRRSLVTQGYGESAYQALRRELSA